MARTVNSVRAADCQLIDFFIWILFFILTAIKVCDTLKLREALTVEMFMGNNLKDNRLV